MLGNFGLLLFAKVLKKKAADKHIKIVETKTAPYECRRVAGQAEVNIRDILKLYAAAFPAKDTNQVIDDLQDFYPLLPGRNVLEIALSNPNMALHVGPAIPNTGWIESTARRGNREDIERGKRVLSAKGHAIVPS